MPRSSVMALSIVLIIVVPLSLNFRCRTSLAQPSIAVEKLARKMIAGVDLIKLVLYKVLKDDITRKYPGKEADDIGTIAAAAVNEIFGCHNDKSKEVFIKNETFVVMQIKDLGRNHPELKRPITDALRVFWQCNYMLSGKIHKDVFKTFDKARQRGIFIEGGERPEPDSFLSMAWELARNYDILH